MASMTNLIDLTKSRFNLVLGGQRSGKSIYAESVVEDYGGGTYVATSEYTDQEMSQRIAMHKERRGDQWQTLEEPVMLTDSLLSMNNRGKPALVDCLTLWLSNIMFLDKEIEAEIEGLCSVSKDLDFPVIFVSNEVGQGTIPENTLARKFIDYAGYMNRRMADVSDSVVLVTAGIPQKLK